MKKLFFALITSFLFIATAWGQCTLDVTPNGKEYVIHASGSSIFYVEEEGYTSLTFYVKRSGIDLIYNDTDVILYDDEFKEVARETYEGEVKSSYVLLTISATNDIRYIRIINNGTADRYVKNIVVKRVKDVFSANDEITFDSRSIGVDVVRSVNLFSINKNDLSIELEKNDGVFSIDKTLIPSCGCDEIVNIKFSPKAYGSFTNNLKIKSNGKSQTIPITAKCLEESSYTEYSSYVEYKYDAEAQFMSSTDGAIEYYFSANKAPIHKNVEKIEFEAKAQKGADIGGNDDMYLKVYEYENTQFNSEKYWIAEKVLKVNTYSKFTNTKTVPKTLHALKFETGLANGSLSRYVKNLKVYSTTILNKNIEKIDFGQVEVGKSSEESFILTFANAKTLLADIKYNNPVTASFAENGQSFYKVEFFQNDEKAEGTQTIKVTFTPSNCVENYDATLTFYNGKTVTINLTGARVRNSGTVSEITWTGAVDTNWDNRANWIKADDNVLSAADVLDEKLKVNIPGGLARYPVIPDVSTPKAFKEDRDKACDCAQVNAGDNATATMIADKIYMESGAALVGVETLKADEVSRYREVQMDFTPERYNSTTGFYEWSLVGPVVKPWDEEGNTRDVVSGDYYLNDLPHVKMHEAVMIKDGEDYIQTWENSFASLIVKIPHDKAFAIRMPNQYGRNSSGYGIPATIYNKRNGTEYDAKKNVTFTFTGRFYNEAGLPEYTGLTPEVPVLLNNTYPANIDADMLQSKGYGTIQCYEGHSFVDVKDRTDAVISSGYGFIFTPKVSEFTIPSDCFQTTKVINNRNAEAEVLSLRLQLKNENVDGVYSTISISHDELKDNAADYAVDAPKLFNDMESNLADLYVMRYDSKWAGLTVPTVEESIPLGIKVRTANQKYRFNLLNSNLDCDIILEDRQEAKEYNLSAGEVCEVSNLAVGDCRCRFYLKTSESTEEDEDVTTDISESEVSTSIDIYANGNSVTVSSNDNIRSIIVSDLSGRQMNYNVNGQYIVLDLPVASGIYTINVIGDNTSRIAKVKLN